MQKRIADALLIRTGHAISAAVSIGRGERILHVCLFDTLWQAEYVQVHPQAERIDLISHHPDGCTAPYAADLENLARLKKMADGKEVRMYLASEYYSCHEKAIAQ